MERERERERARKGEREIAKRDKMYRQKMMREIRKFKVFSTAVNIELNNCKMNKRKLHLDPRRILIFQLLSISKLIYQSYVV